MSVFRAHIPFLCCSKNPPLGQKEARVLEPLDTPPAEKVWTGCLVSHWCLCFSTDKGVISLLGLTVLTPRWGETETGSNTNIEWTVSGCQAQLQSEF